MRIPGIYGITILGLAVLLAPAAMSGEITELSTEVCVVGGGSGGYSSAIAAARMGADCILIERQQMLGGTSTAAYVSNWEPGPGDSIAREIYGRLGKIDAVGITSDHNADHSMDVHGEGARRVHGEMKGPYGVPYRCLIPKGSTNLLVACRGASFSHIGASSCRLSRTIIQLGHAAGTAAAMAVEADVAVGEVDVRALGEELKVDPPNR